MNLSLRNEVLVGIHDCKTAGHMGQAKTLQKLKQRFIWHGMSNDCLLYVRSCGVCNGSKKPNRKAKARLGRYHAGAPLERVHIDILGPLNSSKSGNRYVLMVIDQFTKWLECYPLKDQTAVTVAKAVVNEIHEIRLSFANTFTRTQFRKRSVFRIVYPVGDLQNSN